MSISYKCKNNASVPEPTVFLLGIKKINTISDESIEYHDCTRAACKFYYNGDCTLGMMVKEEDSHD